jgi:hypothetical protein
MARNEFYCQCQLARPVKGQPNAHQKMVSWIPSDIAKVGNIIRLKEWPNDKEWSENWTVVSVGPKTEGGKIETRAGDYKNQRKVSDVERGSFKRNAE